MNRTSARIATGSGAFQAARDRSRRAAGLLLAVFLLVAAPSVFAAEGATAPPWIGHEQEIEEILRHGEIVASREVGRGITKPLKVTLRYQGRELEAIWKPLGRHLDPIGLERYEAEVAAYRLSRHLNLDMVPPTVEREIGNKAGSLQMWVHGYRLAAEALEEGLPTHQEVEDWSRAVARMKFFDELIDNPDRHAANYLVDEDWGVVLIDHSRAMFFDHQGPMRQQEPPKRFDRALVERTRDLDLDELQSLLGDLFSKAQLKNVLHRRNALVSHVDKVVEQRGELAFFEP